MHAQETKKGDAQVRPKFLQGIRLVRISVIVATLIGPMSYLLVAVADGGRLSQRNISVFGEIMPLPNWLGNFVRLLSETFGVVVGSRPVLRYPTMEDTANYCYK